MSAPSVSRSFSRHVRRGRAPSASVLTRPALNRNGRGPNTTASTPVPSARGKGVGTAEVRHEH